jgi:dienelactone hydrolase
VLAWARAPANAMKYRIDPARIALVGQSLGGWLALLGVEHEPSRVCVAGLAAWNLGWAAAHLAEHPEDRLGTLNDLRTETDIAGGPIRANADELLNEMIHHAAAWDYLIQARALKNRPVLLVAATRDTPEEGVERHAELAKAILNAGGKLVRVETFEDDHPFSSHRLELADTLVHWLHEDCTKTQSSATIRRGPS